MGVSELRRGGDQRPQSGNSLVSLALLQQAAGELQLGHVIGQV
jgi:hypothetical protein